MKLSLPVILTLGFLAASALPLAAAQSIENAPQETASEDVDDDAVQRVARVTFVDGDVSFLRAGVDEWADAVQNLPLLEGDQLYVGQGGRAELQLGNGNYIRLSEKTALTIADLSATVAQFEITEGAATIRLERFGAAFTRFEVDTPNSALVLEQDGLYRVNVKGKDESEVIVRKGSAEVATLDGSFKVREGRKLLVDTSPNGRLEVVADNSRDDWDRWTYDRDQTLDRANAGASPDYVTTQETTYNTFYGANELGNYGSWSSVGDYGYCWVPRVSAGWAPYRSGQWLWVPRAGWTWLADEPWGWAPYHYGRWSFLPGLGWAWVPGINANRYGYGRAYYQWRPALVHFYNSPTARGHYVAWYPLTPGERWRRPDHYGNSADNRGHLQYPRDGGRRPDADGRGNNRHNGVSVLPVAGFTRPGGARINPGAPDEEVSRWANRGGGRPGLPEIDPTRTAAAPRSRRSDEPGRSRPVVTPPPDIATRPVVTRHRPSSSQAETGAPRERRLIVPREPRNAGDDRSNSSTERDQHRGNNWRGGRPDRPAGDSVVQPTQRVRPAEDTTPTGGDDAQSRRRERRENKTDQQAPNAQGGGSDGDKERTRTRVNTAPRASDDSANPKPHAGQERSREDRRRSGNEDQSQHRSDDSRTRDKSSNSGADHSDRQRQPERVQPPPPPQRPPETRQEQKQEKQERREERREERRKGQ